VNPRDDRHPQDFPPGDFQDLIVGDIGFFFFPRLATRRPRPSPRPPIFSGRSGGEVGKPPLSTIAGISSRPRGPVYSSRPVGDLFLTAVYEKTRLATVFCGPGFLILPGCFPASFHKSV